MREIISIIIIVFITFILLKILIKLGGRKVEEFNYDEFSDLNDITKRFIKLNHAFNTRDIGGYKGEIGQVVKKGLVYRSDRLYSLTDEDIDILKSLNIKTSIDLRENSSYKRKPNKLPMEVKYLHMPIYKRVYYSVVFATLFNRKSLNKIFEDSYIHQIENNAVEYGEVLKVISNKENLPLMYNCTSGKDRTGLLTALLLSVLGVDNNDIVQDYALSNYNFPKVYEKFCRDHERKIGIISVKPIELKHMLGVDNKWIINALKYIEDNYGTVEYYLITKAQVSKEDIYRLRDNLLEKDEKF